MTTAHTAISLDSQQHIVLTDVSWDLYEHLLREIGNRPIRMTYYKGNLEIMSPLPKHEKWKKRIARMIELIALEWDIDMETLGSTTFKRKAKKVGLEPDECYYIQHAEAVRGKDRLNLRIDPPPDLAVEVDIFSRSIKREPIYRRLGVPELWRFDGKALQILHLHPDKGYVPAEASLALPRFTAAMLTDWLLRMQHRRDNEVLREFQRWLRDHLNS